MANNGSVYQQKLTVSIPREAILSLASDELSKTDYKVLLMLLSELNGYNGKAPQDPENFTEVSVKHIARHIYVTPEKVKKSIDRLLEFGIIEKGSNRTVKNGYRFTF